jgi:hypothetical protein
MAITSKSFSATAALSAVVTAMLVHAAAPARADAFCKDQKWYSDQSEVVLAEDNGYSVWVAASGQTLGPQATQAGGGKPDMIGTAIGGPGSPYHDGNRFNFAVNWSNGWYSQYYGIIQPDGTAIGGVRSDPPPSLPDVPQGTAQLHSLNKFLCEQ